jgi:hypothetical protein
MRPMKRNSTSRDVARSGNLPTELLKRARKGYDDRQVDDGRFDSNESARVKALENMKNHEALYIEYLETISGKLNSKEEELKREKHKIEELMQKNSKVVLKLVSSYFDELKEQWLSNYHDVVQEKVLGGLAQESKKARQKLCKIRKISESFVNGNYEEDLLSYALEKDLSETARILNLHSDELDSMENTVGSSISIQLRREKVTDFFYALQELVDFRFDNPHGQAQPPKLEKQNKGRDNDYHRGVSPMMADHREASPRGAQGTNQPFEEEKKVNSFCNTGKTQPTLAKPLGCLDSAENSVEEIAIRKAPEPARNNAIGSMPRSGQQPVQRSDRSQAPRKLIESPMQAHRHERQSNQSEEDKENIYDNSKLSKEIYDISHNSVNDLINSKLGTTRLQGPKQGSSGKDLNKGMNNLPESVTGKQNFCLHYFEGKSNRLHMVQYEQGQILSDTMELGNFIVPRYHRSLLTNEGVIILTGGSMAGSDKPSNKAFLLDIERTLMTEISEMIVGRGAHAMVHHGGLIYVLGGVTEERCPTDSCEVFSPQLNTWSEIASLNHSCHSACAISANGSIYKFGGKDANGIVLQSIERFNGKHWIELNFAHQKLKLYSNSLVFQVTKNELLILGGTEENYENKTSDSYYLRISDCEKSNTVQVRKGPSLPVREGFWSQEVEWANGKVYMLQNVSESHDKSTVLLSEKRLLEFCPGPEEWRVVEYK